MQDYKMTRDVFTKHELYFEVITNSAEKKWY